MKTTIFSILSFFFFFTSINAQVSILCPADVTVHAFEVDENFESYGDPDIISSGAPFEVETVITEFDNICNGRTITIKYTVEENGTSNSATCIQTISITIASLSDIQLPNDVSIPSGTIEDLDPDLMMERPEPYDILISTSANIFLSYVDKIISNGIQQPYKVLRSWTALNWCLGDLLEFDQVLTIDSLESSTGGVIEIETCFGGTTIAQEVNVKTDQTGFTLDLSNCSLAGNLIGYLNCIAENNDIDPSSNILLEIVGNNDYLNGVSTLDQVITQRHILAISPFADECTILAADLNNDGRVSSLDIVMGRKLILGITPSLSSSSSWRFINGEDYSEDLIFSKAEFPLQNLDIRAVKVGDVNGSASN